MIRTATPILLAALVAGSGHLVSATAQESHPLDRALAPSLETKAAKGPLAAAGTATAFWRTSEQCLPIAKGTVTLDRDRTGGIAVRIALGALGRIEYGADAARAWSVEPERGATVFTGDAARPVRRLLAAIVGDPQWRAHYATATATDSPAAGSAAFTLGGRDRWDVSSDAGRLVAATIHLDSRGQPTTTIAITRRDFGDDGAPRAITIDLNHHRLTLAITRVTLGDAVGDKPVAPTKALLAEAETIEESGDGAIAVKTRTVATVHFASVRKTVKFAEISKALGEIFPEIMFALQKQGIQPIGAPMTRYHRWGPGEADIEAGFPLAKPIEPVGRIAASTLPAGRVATTWHIGPYQTLGQTHQKLRGWIGEHGLRPNGAPWEIYWTDPGLEPDPRKWRTQLVAPVAPK